MNERIKALMGQTLDEKFSGTWSTMDMYDLQKFAERFAELIVRECINQCAHAPDVSEDWYQGVKWVANEIAQHFGVE
jgi:hypothetical protein